MYIARSHGPRYKAVRGGGEARWPRGRARGPHLDIVHVARADARDGPVPRAVRTLYSNTIAGSLRVHRLTGREETSDNKAIRNETTRHSLKTACGLRRSVSGAYAFDTSPPTRL